MAPSEQVIELPTQEAFSTQVDTDFVTRLADGRDVAFRFFRLDPGISSKYQESFSLMFRAPLDVPPEQGLYSFRHSALGDLSLFLVPINQKEDHFLYQAVFNHLKETD